LSLFGAEVHCLFLIGLELLMCLRGFLEENLVVFLRGGALPVDASAALLVAIFLLERGMVVDVRATRESEGGGRKRREGTSEKRREL
jgi:hypothetical protein